MASKTKEQVAENLTAYIKDYNNGIDTQSGSVVYDAFIAPQSELFELGYTDLDTINNSFSPANWRNMSDYQVEQLALTWNLTKNVAQPSQAIVTFFKRQVPQTPITIPSGTIATTTSTGATGSLAFVSTSEVILDNTKWNQSTGRYEVSVLMTCTSTGANTNIASQTIVNTTISAVDGCINKSASYGGVDIETKESLANRIQTASQGRVLGTIPGYRTLVGNISGVSDIAVVASGESGAIRNSYGNEVDIVIVGEIPQSVVDEVTYAEQTQIIFSKQPVINVTYVKNATTGVILPVSAYTFVKDLGALTYSSIEAIDRITINTPSYFTNGDIIEIGYVVNSLVETIQDFLDEDGNKIIGSDVLVREGIKKYINIAFTVKVNSTKSASVVKQELTDAVFQYVNALQLGDAVEQSDIVFYLRDNFDYIDNIILPFNTLVVRPTTPPYFTGTAQDLYPGKYTYYRCDDDSIDLTIL